MISFLKNSFNSRPLRFALIAGLCFRLLSVAFSKGYGMHDDHFLVAEAAQSWVDGYDYNKWLPNPDGTGTPGGHSWFYVGIHYGLFYSMESVGIEDPQVKMFFIRLIHAVYSLLIILLTFKIIVELTNNTRWAGYGALLVSLLWFMPMLSVRNLVEVVCIPPLMGAMLYLIRFDKQRLWKYIFYSGMLVGIAVGIRFQVLFFVAGMGLFILIRKKVLQAAVFGMVFLVALFITQMGDLILWGKPMVEMKEYIIYNLNNSTTYFNAGMELYFLLLLGILIPPLSIFIFYGYFSQWKKMLVVFLPSFVFFAFHTYFPNKQERFILPFVPFLLILGVTGYYMLLEKTQSGFIRKAGAFGWKFFWVMNFILIFPITVMYSKRSRVEVMTYLSHQPDYQNFIVENSNSNIYIEPPQFYSRHWVSFGYFNDTTTLNWLHQWMQSVARDAKQPVPNYILFMEEKNLDQRITNMKKLFPDLEYKTTIYPGFLDRVLHYLNPVNRNESCAVYRISKMPADIPVRYYNYK